MQIVSARRADVGTSVAVTDAAGIVWTTDLDLPPDTELRRALAEWLAAGNTPEPFVPAPPALPPLSPRQFWLALDRLGITEAAVTAAVAAIPSPAARAEAQITLRHANLYRRTDPLLLTLAPAFGLSATQIDAAWADALTRWP